MSQFTWVVTLIPLFPLLGFLLNTFMIRRERDAGMVASGAVVLSFLATLASIAVLGGQPEETPRIDFILWDWISVGTFSVPFGFLFDHLTAVMALLVTGVGSIIHIYSITYMHNDVRTVRFFSALNLFIVAMLMLIMGDNMLLMFLGWEGVGLCSFLLIGHYFDRRSVQPGIVPSDAAMKAFVVNRVGDAGLLLGMMLIFSHFGTLSFYDQSGVAGQNVLGFLERAQDQAFVTVDLGIFGGMAVTTGIAFLILIGVTGKSAQVPLFAWLPDAMAGPTPVSALIHAATMVTAGVYLIARTHPIFAAAEGWVQGLVVSIGVLTALLAATAAIVQMDIKRVLAYSTISQLGYMVAAVGMGAISAGMFHLLTHGIFKALLFLAAGSVIHGAHDHQDMRRMGGLRKAMPTTFWTYLVGALALSGIFPLAGFWSKDEIISYAWTHGQQFTAVLLIIASMITAFYMGRQIALIFFGKQRDDTYHPHESSSGLTTPLVVLAIGTLIGGLINLPGLHWLTSYLEPVIREEAEAFGATQIALATITTLLAAASGYLGWWLYARYYESRLKVGRNDPLFRYTGDIWMGMELGWGFDWVYHNVIARGYRRASAFLSDVFDRQGVDGVLVSGTAGLLGAFSRGLRSVQTGYVRTYALVFFVGVLALVAFFAFR